MGGRGPWCGTQVNETFQSQHGVEPDAFPDAVPTYSGHYHRPHTVPGTAIHYVGSPYQVSWGEAGQRKELLVLDDDWAVAERIPLDLGPRHFRVGDEGATRTEGAAEAEVEVTTEAAEALVAKLRPGDRVRWTVNPKPSLPNLRYPNLA